MTPLESKTLIQITVLIEINTLDDYFTSIELIKEMQN